MDDMYSREQALELARDRRAALDASLAGLSPERMTAPGVMQSWSIKDVLAHIAWWERWMVRVLARERSALAELAQMRGGEGERVVDNLNAATYLAERDRPLAEVLADGRAAFDEAMWAIEALADSTFATYRRVVAANTFEHYEEHARGIREWQARDGGG